VYLIYLILLVMVYTPVIEDINIAYLLCQPILFNCVFCSFPMEIHPIGGK